MKTLTAFCDLAYCPVSYDFTVWLVRAMKERDDRGCDGLHVVLVPKEDGLGGFAREWGEHDEAATRWRLWHIIMAMIPLAGATVTLAASRKQAEKMNHNITWWEEGRAHVAGPLVEAARRGEKIPKLRATDAARRYVAKWLGDTPLITLTTRNQSTHPDRNSTSDWASLLIELANNNDYAVMKLNDTNEVLCTHGGKWPEIDLDIRLAVYERVKMNLIGNNGPAALMLFSEAPFIQFGVGVPDQWVAHMAEHCKMKPGEQYPWCHPDQRIVWKPDTFEIMKEEFENWEKLKSV